MINLEWGIQENQLIVKKRHLRVKMRKKEKEKKLK